MPKATAKNITSAAKRNSTTSHRLTPISPPTFEHPDTYPDLYCLKLDGACMQPLLPDRCSVMFKKSEPFGAGDIVCIWFKPEIVSAGEHFKWLKRLTLNVPPWVKFPCKDHPQSDVLAALIFEQLNPHRSYSMRCEHILAVHKAVGYALTGEVGGIVNSAAFMPIGDGKLPDLN